LQGVPAGGRPEDELERLTKKMLFDMENPPTEEYFGRNAVSTLRGGARSTTLGSYRFH
jgi:hypothetical protein